MTNSRQLSLHERFGITRRNTGFTHIVTFLITYPSSSHLPSQISLAHRIAALQDHFPLLRCGVTEDQTRKPLFVFKDETWSSVEIMTDRHYNAEDDLRTEQEYLLAFERDRMAKDGLDKPLWQISRFSRENRHGRAHLAVSVDHVLTDGKGLQLLLQALLMESIDHLPYETLDGIPRLEETVDLNPKLPSSPIDVERSWPSHPITNSPTTCTPAFSMVHLPPTLLDRLKIIGKSHDTPTLHPILLLSLLISIWSITTPSQNSTPILHATPISVRDPALNHGYCTANYTAVCLIRQVIHPNLDFWTEASTISRFLRSEQGRNTALSAKGQLGHIPDHEDPNRSKEFATGWEEFFLSRARSQHPYGSALGLSNLGFMALPVGAEDMAWSQTVSPFAPVMLVCVISCEKGLRAVAGWREGSVLGREEVEKIELQWEKILNRLAKGFGGETLTVRDLVAQREDGETML